VLGEYIGRVFAEVKGRPLYLVQERIGDPRQLSQERGGDHTNQPVAVVQAARQEKAEF
jgi:hypothetical protein